MIWKLSKEYDVTYKEIATNLSESYYVLEDATKRLEDILDNMDFDGDRLLEVERRLDLIYSITRKYGGHVDDVLAYLEQISKEYALLTGKNLSSNDLDQELRKLEKRFGLSSRSSESGTARISPAIGSRDSARIKRSLYGKGEFSSSIYQRKV